MAPELIVAIAALITGSTIGLGSLVWAIRHGSATLHQSTIVAQDTAQAFAQIVRLIQDVDANVDDFIREQREQHERLRALITSEALQTRTHSTQGHLDTRQILGALLRGGDIGRR